MTHYKKESLPISKQLDKFALPFLVLVIGLYILLQTPFIHMWFRQFFPVVHTVVENTLPTNLSWTYLAPRAINTPPVGNSKIVVIIQDGNLLIAFDNETGQIK